MTDQRNYDGPAVLMSGTDEIEVTADLRIESEPYGDGALHSWGGDLTVVDEDIFDVIGGACKLQLPGRAGRVFVHQARHATVSGAMVASVRGEGPAPWLGDETLNTVAPPPLSIEHVRTLVDAHPETFRQLLRAEIRRDPEWWRGILRRELRLGFLRDDFRRGIEG